MHTKTTIVGLGISFSVLLTYYFNMFETLMTITIITVLVLYYTEFSKRIPMRGIEL